MAASFVYPFLCFGVEPLPRRFVDLCADSSGDADMVNKDQVNGVAKQVKGSVKETAGRVTGNRRTEAEGAAEKAVGKVQKGFGDVKEKVKNAL
jgi:uncharacterized protein YjbJ (UPF0337 family)